MDELNDPVQLWFTGHVDTVYRSLDALHGQIAAATWSIRDALLGGGRLLVGGSGSGCALSQLFCASLLARLSMERPPLPVVPIGNDPVTLGAMADGYGYHEALARHIQAVAAPGDTVLLVTGAAGGGLAHAIRAAHAREARIILLGGGAGYDSMSLPGEDDIDIRIPSEEPPRISECQLLVLNCLVELVEREIFGSY